MTHPIANTAVERARAYLNKLPPAISGAHGHDQTFLAACVLVRFGLTWGEAWPLLVEFNSRCLPPWGERELAHKLADAFKRCRPEYRFQPAQNFRVPVQRIDPATAIEKFLQGFKADEVDLWEASPVRPLDDWTKDSLTLLATLFSPGELVNFVTDYTIATRADGSTKANPVGNGETVERDALLERWRKNGMPRAEAGGWLRMNPLDGQGVSDGNVAAYRFALVECDSVPADLQLSFFAKLRLPVAAILASGGRSLHGWVKVDCDDAESYRLTVGRMLSLLARFGVDTANKNPSRLSRLPGVIRRIGEDGDGRQRLYYLNPCPEQKAIL